MSYAEQDKMCIFDWDLEKAFDAPVIAQCLCWQRAQAGRRAEPLFLSSHLKSHLSCICPVVFWGFWCTPEALCLCDAPHNIYQTEYLIY